MTVKLTAYDTYIGSSHLAPLQRFIDQVIDLDINTGFLGNNSSAFVKAGLSYHEDDAIIPTVISPILASENNLVPCAFPTIVEVPAVGRDKPARYLVSDARAYIRGRSMQEANVVNMRDFEFLRIRTILGAAWLTKGAQPIKAISRILPACYAFWVGDKIASRFILDPGEKLRVRAIAYLFYQCQHFNSTIVDEQDRRMQAAVAAKAIFAEPKVVADIFSRMPVIGSVDEFIECVKDELKTPRLKDLNAGILATLMAGTWYQDGKLQAAVAVEHPPTFVAMVYCAFSQRGYRDTPTFKSLERFKGAKGEQEITRAVMQLCEA